VTLAGNSQKGERGHLHRRTHKLCLKTGSDLGEDNAHVIQNSFYEDITAVFYHKNQMDVQPEIAPDSPLCRFLLFCL